MTTYGSNKSIELIHRNIRLIPTMETFIIELRLEWAEDNIAHYSDMMESWLDSFDFDIQLGEAVAEIALERINANEALVDANIAMWYALQAELVIRRFRQQGGYQQVEDLIEF